MDTILSNRYDKAPRPFHAGALTAYNAQEDAIYSSIQGTQAADPAGPPLTEDSIFWVASLTKIVTAVAVMIVVERGLISLDDDVGKVVPELAAPEVLTGFDEDGILPDGDSRCQRNRHADNLLPRKTHRQSDGEEAHVASSLDTYKRLHL